jgi:OOP family OmpA-OmpF porin
MNGKHLLASLFVGFLLPTTYCHAQGFYAGGGLGDTRYEDSESDFDISGKSAFKIFGGYQLNRNFALEGSFTDFGETDKFRGGSIASRELEGMGLSAVGILPFSRKFEVFGKAGVLAWDSTTRARTESGTSSGVADDDTDLSYGIGASYDLNEDFSLRGEWEVYQTDQIDDVDLFSLGAQYRF